MPTPMAKKARKKREMRLVVVEAGMILNLLQIRKKYEVLESLCSLEANIGNAMDGATERYQASR